MTSEISRASSDKVSCQLCTDSCRCAIVSSDCRSSGRASCHETAEVSMLSRLMIYHCNLSQKASLQIVDSDKGIIHILSLVYGVL